jgi:hypothetical protein
MTIDNAWGTIADHISDRQVLALEQAAIRIPSTPNYTGMSSRECEMIFQIRTVPDRREWPTPDERVKLSDLVTAARAIAYATYRLCR